MSRHLNRLWANYYRARAAAARESCDLNRGMAGHAANEELAKKYRELAQQDSLDAVYFETWARKHQQWSDEAEECAV